MDAREEAQRALVAWAGADQRSRERITNVLDVVMEIADDLDGPLIVVARDILDAATDGHLRPIDGEQSAEEALIAATDLAPGKVVSLLFLVLEVVPEGDVVQAGEVL